MSFKKIWWKVLCVLLLLVVVCGGLYFPLSPGVKKYSPANLELNPGDSFEVKVKTTGASFQQHPEGFAAYIVFDSIKHISAARYQIKNDNEINATFFVPFFEMKMEDYKPLDIYLNSNYNGDIYIPSAISFHQKQNDSIEFNIGENVKAQEVSSKPIATTNTDTKYFSFPNREMLKESIRNLFFHVPMWFGMTILLIVSMVFSMRFLKTKNLHDDIKAAAFARVALIMGLLGIITGALWAKVTWGAWWNNDPKQDAAAVGLLMYLAYFVLRGSMDDIDKRARVAAITNLFFFFIFIPMIYIVPRLTSSLHPGNGGNPGFNTYDLDNHLRLFFYAGVIGWTLLGVWLATIKIKTEKILLASHQK